MREQIAFFDFFENFVPPRELRLLLHDAVVTGGNANMVIHLPKMDKVIGMLDYVDVIAGGHAGSLQPDGTIEAELQVITGATNEMGFNKLSAR